jgi:Rieske Fe-S protein
LSETRSQPDPAPKLTISRPVRIARICTHVECVPPYRRFFFTEEQADAWECPDHGKGYVRVQENRPYAPEAG